MNIKDMERVFFAFALLVFSSIIFVFASIIIASMPSSSNKFHKGDTVHIKINNSKGVVYHEANKHYVVQYSDNVGVVHELGVYEDEIENYAEKN